MIQTRRTAIGFVFSRSRIRPLIRRIGVVRSSRSAAIGFVFSSAVESTSQKKWVCFAKISPNPHYLSSRTAGATIFPVPRQLILWLKGRLDG
jgi:hypothetical protein